MKFNGATFQFGKVEVVVGAFDTEKATGSIEFNVPIGEWKVGIHLDKTNTWNEEKSIQFRLSAREIKPATEDENDDFYNGGGKDEEESA